MKTVQLLDKKFVLSISEKEIRNAINAIAKQINTDLKGKNPLFVGILNGSFMFAADLMKRVTITSEITFIKVASYTDTQSTGIVKELLGLECDVKNRPIVIVEDIVDTGLTMQRLLETLGTRNPKAIHIATLLVKPDKLQVELDIKYCAMRIPNDFIVGYGLDYDGYGRNYPDIYTLAE